MDALYDVTPATTNEKNGKNASAIQLDLRIHSGDRRDADTPPICLPLAIDATHPIVAPLRRYIADRDRVTDAKDDDGERFKSAVMTLEKSADDLASCLSKIRVSPWMKCIPDLDARHVKRRAAVCVTRLHARLLRDHSGRRASYCVMAYNALTFAGEFIAGDLESESVSRLPEFESVTRSHCADAMRMAVEITRCTKSSRLGVGEEAMGPMDIIVCSAFTFAFVKCAMGALSRLLESKPTLFAFFSDDDDTRNSALMQVILYYFLQSMVL
ncbi:hypothetical protein CYMTET_2529 [Cymbomonas tetramitiformis]|uniref:Uncharacterized protein n=1 Tax=Cymbomonas tetramitiformis TaxID=36881 RepID=A0AAE0H6V9_9CHLO|nr:hypothetical protein CYMTET_2529 [Cymbomonas tetramitiformis]